jgi:hypothetical protein
MTNRDEPLWRLVLERLATHSSASNPSGQDRARIRWVLWELYLLGERPTAAEIRAARPTDWSRAVAELWQERLREPCRNVRGSGWRYPFLWPFESCVEHGLDPIEVRLERELTRVSRVLSNAITRGEDDAQRQLDDELYMHAQALSVWAQTRLAFRGRETGDVWGPGLRLPRRRPLISRPPS